VEDWERVDAMLTQVLDTVVNVYAPSDLDLPTLRYVCVGTPVVNCDQVTVSLRQLYRGIPGLQEEQPSNCMSPLTAVIEVQVVRCAKVVDARGNTLIEPMVEASTIYMRDANMLMLIPSSFAAQATYYADITVAELQGQYWGPTMNLVIEVQPEEE